MVDFETAKAWVARRLSQRRLEHSLRVAGEAARLALRWGVDVDKARLAGILHDAARDLDHAALQQLIATHGIEITEQELQVVELLHAPVGAYLAHHELGIDDADLRAAIRYHTTGRANMSDLEKVIFLADYIEPDRNFPGVHEVRVLADTSLDEALRRAFDQSIEFLVKRGKTAHPFTVAARNALPVPGKV